MNGLAVRPLNIIALCAGYGGLELGLQLATGGKARCVCMVEREAPAAAVLVKEMEAGHISPAPIWPDLATFDARPWRGVVDCVTAGFPCQPASVAGARLGTADPRWLWPLVARVIEDCAPNLVFLENVPGLRTKGLRDVLEDLAAMGFDAEWGCLSAGALGAPQGRDRLWILAYRDREQLREQSRGWGWPGGSGSSQPGWDGQGVADAAGSRREERDGSGGPRPEVEPASGGELVGDTDGQGQPQQGRAVGAERRRAVGAERRRAVDAGNAVVNANGIREQQPHDQAPTIDEGRPGTRQATGGASLRAWPPGPDCADWPTDEPKPAICREAPGNSMPLGVSLRMLGNGVVPVQAAAAFRALLRRVVK